MEPNGEEAASRRQQQQRDDEMSRLRSNSASPSTLSTASSVSPLVRGGQSGCSGKRPASTSIAAAQLQCQQHQHAQLDAPKSSAGGAGTRLKLAGVQVPGFKSSGGKPGAAQGDGAAKKAAKQESKQPGAEQDMGLGYRLAKSAAFQAYRFNELWSANKMRYLNLACLLMTLICLVAILLLSGNNASGGGAKQEQPANGNRRAADAAALSGALESIDTLESQAFVGPPSPPAGRPTDTTSGPSAAAAAATSGGLLDNSPVVESAFAQVEPLLSRMFGDLELVPGGLVELLKKNSSKPIVRRTKNGATIVISATSSLNDSSAAAPASGLLGKLLPPLFRSRADNHVLVSSEPQLVATFSAASSSPGRPGSSGSFLAGPLEASSVFGSPLFGPSPFAAAAAAASGHFRQPGSLFLEPPGAASMLLRAPAGFLGPFGSALSSRASFPAPLPPPGLLGMLLRAQQVLAAGQESEDSRETQRWPAHSGAAAAAAAANETAGAQPGNATESSNQLELFADLDSASSARARHARRGSMLLLSEGGLDQPDSPAPFASPMSGFLPFPGSGQLLFLGGGGAGPNELALERPNPLASLFGGLVSELNGQEQAAAAVAANKSSSSSSSTGARQVSGSAPAPSWTELQATSIDEPEWQPADERWDEQPASTGSRHLRARHRNELETELDESGDFLSGLAADGPQLFRAPKMLLGQPQLIARQSLRHAYGGPAAALERLVGESSGAHSASPAELSRVFAAPAEVRSQAVRADDPLERPSIFLRPLSERFDSAELNKAPEQPMPPQLGFIGRLLSELSARAVTELPEAQPIAMHARGFASRASQSADPDDLEEGEESSPPATPTIRRLAPALEPASEPASEPARRKASASAFKRAQSAPAASGAPSEDPKAPEKAQAVNQLAPGGPNLSNKVEDRHFSLGAPSPAGPPPLFGLPVVSGAGLKLMVQRQPRSFTYHSNHEIAASVNELPRQAAPIPQKPAQPSSVGRKLPATPFALHQQASGSSIQGRRLDDFHKPGQPDLGSEPEQLRPML